MTQKEGVDSVHTLGFGFGCTGIGLGRNPNGAVHDMREGFAALANSPSSLLVMTIAILASYGLRLADAIDNWTFVICLIAIPLVASIVATLSAAAEQRTKAKLDGIAAEVPLEWIGIDRQWNDDDIDALDRYLGTSESEWEPSGAARG